MCRWGSDLEVGFQDQRFGHPPLLVPLQAISLEAYTTPSTCAQWCLRPETLLHPFPPKDAGLPRCWGLPWSQGWGSNPGVANDPKTFRHYHNFHQLVARKDRVPLSNALATWGVDSRQKNELPSSPHHSLCFHNAILGKKERKKIKQKTISSSQ